jgi:hypothetical protein
MPDFFRCLGRVLRGKGRQLHSPGAARRHPPDRGLFGCLADADAHDGRRAGRCGASALVLLIRVFWHHLRGAGVVGGVQAGRCGGDPRGMLCVTPGQTMQPFGPHPNPLPQSPGFGFPGVVWWERERRAAVPRSEPQIFFTNRHEVGGVWGGRRRGVGATMRITKQQGSTNNPTR